MDLETLKANAAALNLETEKQYQREKAQFLEEFDAQTTIENALTKHLTGDHSDLLWKKPAWLSKEMTSITLYVALSDAQKDLLKTCVTHHGQEGYELAMNAFENVTIQDVQISCSSVTRIDYSALRSLYQTLRAKIVIQMPRD